VRSLVAVLTGTHQVEYACEILSNLGLEHLDTLQDVLADAETLGDVRYFSLINPFVILINPFTMFLKFISDKAFGESIVGKPNSMSTRHRMQASLIALLPGISKPSDVAIEWLQEVSSSL